MEEKVNHFNMLNQTNLKKKHLFCAICENWLTDAIFLRADGFNYCPSCTPRQIPRDDVSAEEQEVITLRNDILEEILSNLKYPCKNEECSFIGNAIHLKQHQNNGPHNKIKCHICQKTDFFMISHLMDQHSLISISINEPVATIKLDLEVENTKNFVISCMHHIFVVLVEFIDGFLRFTVGSDSIQKLLSSNNFTICYENQDNKITVSGKIQEIRSIIKGSGEKRKIFLPPSETDITLKIYFCDYQLVQHVIDECPICCNHLTAEVYQCQNGHSVCSECKPKITSCPICRVAMQNTKFFLNHVLSNCLFPCSKVNDGCLHLAKPIDLIAHLTECFYVKVNCVECKESHLKLQIVDHLIKMHNVSNNLCMLTYNREDNVKSSSVAYIRYKDMIFRFTIMTPGVQNAMTFNCNVTLLHCDKEAVAQKYRYEVHLLDPHNDLIVLKLSNMCQIMSDENISSSIQLELCKKYLKKNANQWSFNCKFYIFEVFH